MADFVQKTVVKTATRKLAVPIADAAAFNTIVQSVITTNPFACTAYETAGVNHAPVEKTREAYTAKFFYQDDDAKSIGTSSEKYNTLAGYNAGITAMRAAADNIAAHAGTIVHDAENDTFSATLKCHDANGEVYIVTFGRTTMSITSYSDDAIRTTIETWADSVAALA